MVPKNDLTEWSPDYMSKSAVSYQFFPYLPHQSHPFSTFSPSSPTFLCHHRWWPFWQKNYIPRSPITSWAVSPSHSCSWRTKHFSLSLPSFNWRTYSWFPVTPPLFSYISQSTHLFPTVFSTTYRVGLWGAGLIRVRGKAQRLFVR